MNVCLGCFAVLALVGCRNSSGTSASGPACRQAQDCGDLGDGAYCQWPPETQCGQAQGQGTCALPPSACPAESEPVCGCDGLTYDTACRAAQLGVSVARDGACAPGAPGQEGRPCAGLELARCEPGLFCSYLPETQCGQLSKRGICTRASQACSGPPDPVCGCDGRTYQSPCLAVSAGVSVARAGDCSTAPGAVNSPCGLASHVPCLPGHYCMFPPRSVCGLGDSAGVCQVQPTQCPDHSSPVCGCDGKTYLNDCRAARQGISVEHFGFCEGTGKSKFVCDESGQLNCPPEWFCQYPIDSQCGQAPVQGFCEKIEHFCDLDEDPEEDTEAFETQGDEESATGGEGDQTGDSSPEPTPVCGCDDRSYPAACFTKISGVSVAHPGACATANPVSQSGEVCSDVYGMKCAEGLFCSYSYHGVCDAEESLGRCEVIPKDCPNDKSPVCGCDRVTYLNACMASMAQASIDYPFECDGEVEDEETDEDEDEDEDKQ